MMTPPEGNLVGTYEGYLADLFADESNGLKAHFQKVTGANIEYSPFGTSMDVATPNKEDVERIKALFKDMESGAFILEGLNAVLKKHAF